MLLRASSSLYFLWLRSIPLFEYTIVCLSILLFTGHLDYSKFGGIMNKDGEKIVVQSLLWGNIC